MKKLLLAITVLTALTISSAKAENHGDRDHHHGWKDDHNFCTPVESVPDGASTAGLAALAFGAIVIGRHFTRKNA